MRPGRCFSREKSEESSRYKRTARLVLAALSNSPYPLSLASLVRYVSREFHLHESEFTDHLSAVIAKGLLFGAIRRTQGMFTLGRALIPYDFQQVPSVIQAANMYVGDDDYEEEENRPRTKKRATAARTITKNKTKRKVKASNSKNNALPVKQSKNELYLGGVLKEEESCSSYATANGGD